MKLSAEGLTLLKCIAVEKNGKTTIPQIGMHYLGCPINHKEAREELVSKGLLDEEQLNVFVSDFGWEFLKKYDSYGLTEIFAGKYPLVLLRFLHDLNEGITSEAFPECLQTEVPEKRHRIMNPKTGNFFHFSNPSLLKPLEK